MTHQNVRRINQSLTSSLTQKARQTPRKRLNFNFHQPQDRVQRFLNAIEPESYIRPHRHTNPSQDEIFLVLKGKGAVIIFDERGKIEETILLDAQAGHWGVDIPGGIYHTVVALEKESVFFEVKEGPYQPSTNKTFAPWTPEENTREAEDYLKSLITSIPNKCPGGVMPSLVSFSNVSLFKDQSFGVNQLTFDIRQGGKYHLIVETEEQLNTVVGLLEGRYRCDSGSIQRKPSLFVQSDRLLLGDKAYGQHAAKWLALHSEFFRFGGRPHSKYGFIDTLNAHHIKFMPIYKLDETDRIKFTLLSLAFQESGLQLISRLLTLTLGVEELRFLER